jgi:membrane protein
MDRLLKSLPGRVAMKYIEDQAPNWAALIAWNALFALFPIVLFAASLLGFALQIFGASANAKVYDLIFSAIPGDPKQQSELIHAVSGVKSASGVFFVIGLLGTLWGGSALFGVMEQAFAVIYHTKPRDFVRQKLISFAMVLLFTVLVGIAVVGSTLVAALKKLPEIPGVPTVVYSGFGDILPVIVGVVAGFILFLTIYYVVPNRQQDLGKVLPGALVSGVCFELVTLLFPLYVNLNRGINQYGATFALIFVLMTFFFFVGLITMLGAEVNNVLHPRDVEKPVRAEGAAKTPREAMQRGAPQLGASTNGERGPVRRGIKPRTAVLVAVGASIVGVLLGRRSTSS